MMPFTTRQREILKIILDANRPIGSVELAKRLRLTPRQVNYSIQGVRVWLRQHDQELNVLPGTGFSLNLTPDQTRRLIQKINVQSEVQIVLSASQRQQLLALFLLTRSEPFILAQLEQLSQVSRVTVLKDLNEINTWLGARQISLIRKPHFGVQIRGSGMTCEEALAELLWGETPFSQDPIVQITHADGLRFNLEGDAWLLPLAKPIGEFLSNLHIQRTIGLVSKLEEQLEGRFTDDAVLHLALFLAITSNLIQTGNHLEVSEYATESLKSTSVWPVAVYAASRLGREANVTWNVGDIARIAMEMLAAPRDEGFPGEREVEEAFAALSTRLMQHTSQAFSNPKIKDDKTLLNGLLNNIVPAYYREHYNLWFPQALNNPSLPDSGEREYRIALEISQLVRESTGMALSPGEINNLVDLLRAAVIRNSSNRTERVIIICPSGMATSQFLVARLHIRFPHLRRVEVVSLRDLTPGLVATADLVLTTVPLSRQFANNPKVIQVHPSLTPEDVEKVTQFIG